MAAYNGMTESIPMLLTEICKHLDTHDVAALKYLLQDHISAVDLEKCEKGIDVFGHLDHDKHVLAVTRIAHCLSLMDQRCLVTSLGYDQIRLKKDIENDISILNPYRKALFNVAHDLSEEEVDKMINIALSRLQNISPALRQLHKTEHSIKTFSFLNILEKRQDISSNDCLLLYNMLEHIKRTDLQQYIARFTVSEELCDIYPMNTDVRGKCIIINNQVFHDKKRFPDRHGSQCDEAALRDTFGKLQFQPVVIRNLKASQILEYCRLASAADYSACCAFVLCILSHGERHVVFGVDGVPVFLRHITDCFMASNCKTLSGKPKICFIQACQGSKEQTLQQKPRTRQNTHNRNDITALSPEPMSEDEEEEGDVDPDLSDFLMAYSAIPGYISYRNENSGSWFIRTLCRHINEKHQSYHLLDIMTDVNNDLSQQNIVVEGGFKVKTMPMQQSTLRKKIFFFPENMR